jgi:hypothetical protein
MSTFQAIQIERNIITMKAGNATSYGYQQMPTPTSSSPTYENNLVEQSFAPQGQSTMDTYANNKQQSEFLAAAQTATEDGNFVDVTKLDFHDPTPTDSFKRDDGSPNNRQPGGTPISQSR